MQSIGRHGGPKGSVRSRPASSADARVATDSADPTAQGTVSAKLMPSEEDANPGLLDEVLCVIVVVCEGPGDAEEIVRILPDQRREQLVVTMPQF
jgi:hypothetical protein